MYGTIGTRAKARNGYQMGLGPKPRQRDAHCVHN